MPIDNKKILIVEDEPLIRDMYAVKLKKTGFSIETADDGQQGLEKAESFKPDLILLDLKMPIMTGDEMLQKLRQTDWGASMRVIILTNISRDEAPRALRMLSVDRFLVKAHFTPAQIADICKEVLGIKHP